MLTGFVVRCATELVSELTIETLVELEDCERKGIGEITKHRLEEPTPRKIVYYLPEIYYNFVDFFRILGT